MANDEHVEILRQGAEVWNKWRAENNTVEPDLVGADLKGLQLDGINLIGTIFGEAQLQGATIKGQLEWCTFRRANLQGANLTKSFIKEADFIDADLSGANLTDTLIIDVQFHRANMNNTYFKRADISRVNFSQVDLTAAEFFKTNLVEVDFTDVNLRGANLIGADLVRSQLKGAQLSWASIGFTSFADMDLSEVQGLERVKHFGPSTLGLDTLMRSRGQIPSPFLQACGVPAEFVDSLLSLTGQPTSFNSCFISYHFADKAFAHQLQEYLRKHGVSCWLKKQKTSKNHDIFDEDVDDLEKILPQPELVLLCASKDSLNFWGVGQEIDRAFRDNSSRILLIVDLDGFLFEGWQNWKAKTVQSRVIADFVGWETNLEKMRQGLEAVLKALRTDGGREEPPKSLL